MHKFAAEEGKVSGKTAFLAAKAGDKAGQAVVDAYVKYVAEGIISMVNLFRPDCVLIGGGVSNEGDYFMKRVQRRVNRFSYGGKRNPRVEVRKAELKNDAGILGAVALCRYKLINTKMKFVNREYGFEGRPPFVKEFSDVRTEGVDTGKIELPAGPFAALGSFARRPNGIVIVGDQGSLWELRFSYFKNGKWVDSEAFGEVAPRYVAGDPDGKFRYVCHGDVAASMVRYSKRAAVLSLVVLNKVRIRLSFTALTPSGLKTDIRAGDVRASSFGRAVARGKYTLEEDFFKIEGRYEAVPDEGDGAEREYARAVIICGGAAGEYTSREDGADYETVLDTDNSRLAAYIVAGKEADTEYVPSLEEINRGVNNAELDYSAHKPVGAGALAEFASEVFAKTVSHKIYNPLRDDTEYAENVADIDENYSADPTAFAIGGLCAALTGDANAEQCVMSAGEPAAGALAAWTAFMRTRWMPAPPILRTTRGMSSPGVSFTTR